ncbi:hypothetical protein D3C78_1614020 [compost metagenome]
MYRIKEVHAAEVLWALQRFRQVINRNGRGIGRQYGIFTDQAFHFGQYCRLNLWILDHGFDDHLRAFDTGVIQRRLNGR